MVRSYTILITKIRLSLNLIVPLLLILKDNNLECKDYWKGL